MSDKLKIYPVINFSDEQEQLLEVATNFCRNRWPNERIRQQIKDEDSIDAYVWQEIVELGWPGVAIPEEYGGSGLDLAEVVTLVEPMGQYLLASPLVSTTVVAQALIVAGTDNQKSHLLPAICEGSVASQALSEPHGDWDLLNLNCKAEREHGKLSLSGTKNLITDAHVADIILVSVIFEGEPALVMVAKEDIPQSSIRRETIIDETRRSYRLCLDGIAVPVDNLLRQEDTIKALNRIELVSCLLHTAEICGANNAAINTVVEYLNTRKQFGRFIGSYQALKHPTVQCLQEYEAARSLLYYAASVFENEHEGEVAVRMAKAQAGMAFSFIADRAIQFHGGFGFTYECDAQLYRRRAIWHESQFGDGNYHRQKLAELLL